MTYRGASTLRPWELAGVVAYYQPVGAPSAVNALQNMGRGKLGTYTAAPGVAPTWSPVTGWEFNSSAWLQTSIVQLAVTWSVICRFSKASQASYLFGSWTNTSINSLGYVPSWPGDIQFFNNGGQISTVGGQVAGIMAITNKLTWLNGVQGVTIPAGGSPPSFPIVLGAVDISGSISYRFSGIIPVFAIYSRPLTAAEVWLASKQMTFCEQNPDWNAWAPRRRYWIIAPAAAAGRVGIYGRRGAVALPGGVQIKSVGGDM